jgi:hypothetical protein
MISFFISFILLFSSFNNGSNYSLIEKIEFRADGFTTDNLGNIYLSRADELRKYDLNGKLQFVYSDKSLGRISFVDASNFLKILLFYRDFSKIIFLDNMLAPSGEPIALQQYRLEQSLLAATSHNNGVWFFDGVSFELFRLDHNFKRTTTTGNLMQLLRISLNPNYLIEANNLVFLNNPKTGILVFDIFGTYSGTVPIKGLKSFRVFEDKIFYCLNNEFRSYNLKTKEEAKFEIPLENPLDVRIEKNRLYIWTKEGLSVYSMN